MQNTPNTPDRSRDKRYPYTYAADLIRSIAGPELSQAYASQIWHQIVAILEVDGIVAAKALANYYLENEAAITEASFQRLLKKQ